MNQQLLSLNPRSEKRLVYILLGLFGAVFFTIAFWADSQLGGGDNISHYKIAHFSWQYPRLLLDHWGKPVFTLLSAPFAAIGFIGMRLYNILVALLTAYTAYHISRKLGLANSWLVVVLILFTPMYFPLMFGALTEPTFALFILLSVFLLIEKRYVWAAIALSFLFLVRTEGFVLYPLFIAYYILRKQYKALPFLLTGFLVYSIIGSFHYHDFLWLINEVPYHADSDKIYGSGSLFKFIHESDRIFGIPLIVLFLIGVTVFLINNWFKKLFSNDGNTLILLLTLSFFTYFAAHSYLWWKGTGGSAGLIRVMGAVTPLIAFAALYGLNFLIEYIKNLMLQKVLILLLLGIYIQTGFSEFQGSFRIHTLEKAMRKTSYWMKEQKLDENYVVYFMEFVWFYTGLNPYDKTECKQNQLDKEKPSRFLEKNAIIVWEPFAAPHQYGITHRAMENDPSLTHIKRIVPETSFEIHGEPFFVDIYQKTDSVPSFQSKIDSLYLNSFEKESLYPTTDSVYSHGRRSAVAGEEEEFIEGYIGAVSELSHSPTSSIEISVKVFTEQPIQKQDVLLVQSVEQNGKTLDYRSSNFNSSDRLENGWYKTKLFASYEKGRFPPEATVKVYVWNKGRNRLYVDEFRIKKVY